ncbi:MAG: mycofactocin system FadH/OYE family oxidoreductase 2 [Firmicutes bacterium]|nr:mycofactocin system FadH/OYE family oxidoreductase 2 [Bacillota bacterium]
MSGQFEYLFTPVRLGKVTIPNRIVFPAHLTNLAEGNMPGERLAYYYAERAKGGAGLIITEEQSVHPTDRAYEKLIDAYKKDIIQRYRLMTGMVHQYGAKIFAQINHNGNQGSSMYTRLPVWAPSPVPDPLFREVPKEMDKFDIIQLVESYANVSGFVKEGGFDGLELQCSHSSIIRQFLSPLTNQRQDEYGGSLDNRLRLLIQIVKAIRKVVGSDFVVGVRLSGDEFADGGLGLGDMVEIARKIDETGMINYINTSVGIATRTLYLVEGSMCMPPGYSVYLASAIKRAVRIPVIAVGRIKDPNQADQILRDGHADMIGMVRAQIADPEFARKAFHGNTDYIRVCLSCNQDCIGRVGINRDIGCVQNPAVGREKIWGTVTLKQADKRKRVYVVGGGPAGMEAAKTAARRGHVVKLLEKENDLGGQVRYASRLPFRAEFEDVIRNLKKELETVKVDIRLGVLATSENLLREHPDVVIVATGSLPQRPPIPGCNQENVFTVWQVLTEKVQLGKKVLIVDQVGFYQGSGIAELLADQGKEVEIISPFLYVSQGLARTLDLELWYRRAREKGIVMTPNVSLIAIERDKVKVIHNYSGEEMVWENIDSVVLAFPHRANDELYFALKGEVAELYRIGDCLAPRRVGSAIMEGHRVAREL